MNKIPYFVLPVFFDKDGQKIAMNVRAFNNYIENEEVSDILPEMGFLKFLKNNQQFKLNDLLIHLCRQTFVHQPLASKQCILMTCGKFSKTTNFVTIIFEEGKYEEKGVVVPNGEELVKLVEDLSTDVQNKEIRSDSAVPNFSFQFSNLRMELFKEKKNFPGIKLSNPKDYNEPILDEIAKNSDELQIFLQYFFLNSAIKTFTIRGYNQKSSFLKKRNMLNYLEENFDGPFRLRSLKDYHFTDYLEKKDIETVEIGDQEKKEKKKTEERTKIEIQSETIWPKIGKEKSTIKANDTMVDNNHEMNEKNRGKRQVFGKKPTSEKQKRKIKVKEKPQKELKKSHLAKELLLVVVFLAVLVIGVVVSIRVVDDLRNNDYSKNIPGLQEKEAIKPIVTKEEIRQLDLPKNLRDHVNEAAVYLSKIQKSSRYSSRYTKNQRYYFPDGDNRVYPYKRNIINGHIQRLSSIIAILEGNENINPSTTKQLIEIDQNLRKHLDDFFPNGFSKKTFRALKIPESEINEDISTNGSVTKSVYHVAEDYGISPWTLLLDFNPANIKLLHPDGFLDENGDPIVEFAKIDQDHKEMQLLVYIRK